MSNKYDEAIKAAEYNRLAAYDAADRALDGACHPAYKALRKAQKKAYKDYEQATAYFQNANRAAYDAADATFNEACKKAHHLKGKK